MSYAVATVIYGVLPNTNLTKALKKLYGQPIAWESLEEKGIHQEYEGNPEYWFGVALHDSVENEIGEGQAFDLAFLPQVTAQARSQFALLLSGLPASVRAHIGEPGWWMVWGRT